MQLQVEFGDARLSLVGDTYDIPGVCSGFLDRALEHNKKIMDNAHNLPVFVSPRTDFIGTSRVGGN